MTNLRWIAATRLRLALTAVAVVLLVPAGALAWWLGSPLFLDDVVDEAFPVAAAQPTATPTAEPAPTATASPTPSPAPTATSALPDPTPAAPLAPTATPTPSPTPALEPTPTPTESSFPVALKAGEFHDADSFHRGSGTATVYQLEDGSRVLRLEDFEVTNGPDLHVLLSTLPDAGDRSGVGFDSVDLGELKGNVGNQNYAIPDDVDLSQYGSVIIYCVPFKVVFSAAPLA